MLFGGKGLGRQLGKVFALHLRRRVPVNLAERVQRRQRLVDAGRRKAAGMFKMLAKVAGGKGAFMFVGKSFRQETVGLLQEREVLVYPAQVSARSMGRNGGAIERNFKERYRFLVMESADRG